MTWADVRTALRGNKPGLRHALTLEQLGFPAPTGGLNWSPDGSGAVFFWRNAAGHNVRISTEQGTCSFAEPGQDQR